MTSPTIFFQYLFDLGVRFYTGVPDSLLKEFCRYIDAILPEQSHVIAANEGTAVAIATGYHLATGSIPVVYLQNSGLGNTINPLLSLADPEVYSIPMILLIGWRGAPGEADEPQHAKQGRVTEAMLKAAEIPYRVLDGGDREMLEGAQWAVHAAKTISGPVALLVQKGVFGKAEVPRVADNNSGLLAREAAITIISQCLSPETTVVATTGMISRELFEIRRRAGDDGASDFLTVGSMGHASQIALGLSNALLGEKIVCLDGDGALIMHMGGLATAGIAGKGDLLHIVLNNGAHDSVGGQPTVAMDISLTKIAKACGYGSVIGPVETEQEIRTALAELQALQGVRFVEIRVAKGSRADLGRPTESPMANKQKFIARLRG